MYVRLFIYLSPLVHPTQCYTSLPIPRYGEKPKWQNEQGKVDTNIFNQSTVSKMHKQLYCLYTFYHLKDKWVHPKHQEIVQLSKMEPNQNKEKPRG